MEIREITAILRQIVKEETCQCGKIPLVGVAQGKIIVVCDRCYNQIVTINKNIEEIKTLWIQENQWFKKNG